MPLYIGDEKVCAYKKIEPVISSLSITPTTSAQTITAPSGTDGYNPISVSAVTSSIDSNITAGNIKSGVTILGVVGTLIELQGETREVILTNKAGQTFNPVGTGKNAITSITVTPNNQTKTLVPSTSSQTITVPNGYSGFGTLTVNPVTSAIDSNIVAGNIKSGVTILGVTGTYEGLTPTGTLSITTNGTYDVTNYASAEVYVSSGSDVGIRREVSANGVYQMPASNFTFSLPSNATDMGTYAMGYAFYNCTSLTSVDLSSLTTISGNHAIERAFSGCTSLTSVDLSNLTTISGQNAMNYAFYNCTGLTSVDLSSLTTISGQGAMNYTFSGCTGLTSVDLSSLTTVSGIGAMERVFNNCTNLTTVDLSSLTTVSGNNAMTSAFRSTGLTSVNFNNLQTIGANTPDTINGHFSYCFNSCYNLTSITFPKLEKIYCTGGTTGSYGTFANNDKVQKMYFPKLDTITYGSGANATNQNACKKVFYGCSALTELHFAATNQAAIEASPGYSTAWGRGAGNVTIYFDL